MTVGYIHSIESMGLVDGPGIRTVIFMQGCRLRCIYCHNPDTWELSQNCVETLTPEQLIEQIIRFKAYYGNLGGVTFSGGEPLIQAEFLNECLISCKNEGINTCIDTSGCGMGNYEEILKHTDLVLYDVKHYTEEGYLKITGRSWNETLRFLECVQKMGVPLWIRHVVVPGITNGDAHLEGLEKYLKSIKNIERVELLPYHTLGAKKYKTMGIPYILEGVSPLTPESLKEWNDRLNRNCVLASQK